MVESLSSMLDDKIGQAVFVVGRSVLLSIVRLRFGRRAGI